MPTGQFTAEPVSVTINGEVKTWCGRGRKPKWLSEYETANGAVRASKKARSAAADTTTNA
jgi:DNA-binding protein H-NS